MPLWNSGRNAEAAAVYVEVHDPVLGGKLGAELDAVVARSREVTLAEVDSRNLAVRFRDGVAKLFSPFL